MLPFPSPNEGMNRALEGTEQQELENEALDAQGRNDDDLLITPDTGGAQTKKASEETLGEDN